MKWNLSIIEKRFKVHLWSLKKFAEFICKPILTSIILQTETKQNNPSHFQNVVCFFVRSKLSEKNFI